MMKLTLYIIACFVTILISCVSIQTIYVGDSMYVTDYEQLLIKKDGRFSYLYRSELIEQRSAGSWLSTKNTLVLNSDEIFKHGVLRVVELIDSSSMTFVRVIDQEGDPLELVQLTMNHSIEHAGITNKMGESIIKKVNITSIQLFYLGIEYNYIVEVLSPNHLTITLEPKNLEEIYFAGKEFEIRHNKVIDKDGKAFKLKRD